jgi:hypothetical protein
VLQETLSSYKNDLNILKINKTKEEKEKDKKDAVIHIPYSHYETDIANDVFIYFFIYFYFFF